MSGWPDFTFDPLLSMELIIAFCLLALCVSAYVRLAGLKSFVPRLLAIIFVTLALLNPQRVEQEREPISDEVLVLMDTTESTNLGNRSDILNHIKNELLDKLGQDTSLEITQANITPDVDGTRLATTLVENLGQLPQSRLAGVIAITDGQIHDLPDNPSSLLPEGIPFHAIILDDPSSRDRRIRPIVAPRYGLVGEQAEFIIHVDDPGHEGERALIDIRLNGNIKARFPAIIGNRVSIPMEIERRGINTVELNVAPADNELTYKNNFFVAEISGIRDQMRVLLVTGAPHQGARAWRNLLKSDPAVDLVHFTILTTPGVKDTRAYADELSLIEFPTAQLFEEKLEEFDLIIFDQFTRRQTSTRSGRVRPILYPRYIHNIAQYVENGGALLIATGPAFAGENSLYRSPLAAILPVRPTGKVSEYAFLPRLSDKGRRHPVTASLSEQADQNWGSWFRLVDSDLLSGDILMSGADDEPLLVIDKAQEGRVAILMSDQAWLWARGYDGGGPYREMFRRLAHWLLGEPDLDAEKLIAKADGDNLVVEHRTLSDKKTQTLTIHKPDNTTETLQMEKIDEGVFQTQTSTAGHGAYRLETQELSTVTAIGALNPKEFSDLTPTADILEPLTSASGGTTIAMGLNDPLPQIRRISPQDPAAGQDWMGLIAHEDYAIRQSSRTPLTPTLIYFLLGLACLAWAWRRESL